MDFGVLDERVVQSLETIHSLLRVLLQEPLDKVEQQVLFRIQAFFEIRLSTYYFLDQIQLELGVKGEFPVGQLVSDNP